MGPEKVNHNRPRTINLSHMIRKMADKSNQADTRDIPLLENCDDAGAFH